MHYQDVFVRLTCDGDNQMQFWIVRHAITKSS